MIVDNTGKIHDIDINTINKDEVSNKLKDLSSFLRNKRATLTFFNKPITIFEEQKYKTFNFDYATVITNNPNNKPPMSLYFKNKELYVDRGYKTFQNYLKENFNKTLTFKNGETLFFIENIKNENVIAFEVTSNKDLPLFINETKYGIESFLIPISEDKCIIQSGDELMELNNQQIKKLNKTFNKKYNIGFIDMISI